MTTKTNIAIMCGGSTYEHEVSIISGIQIAQNIDRTKYEPFFVYFDKNNDIFLIKGLKTSREFKQNKRVPVDLVKRDGRLVIRPHKLFKKALAVDICFMAFHGGAGESGPIQGMLELFNVPYTGATLEGAVITMNKSLTKEVLINNDVPVLPWVTVFGNEFQADKTGTVDLILEKLELPIICKPVHLGSSIGIKIVHTKIELEQQLSIATRTDSEVLLEPAIDEFTEYNISVRSSANGLAFSPIEEPVREGKVLSFDDKYANGGKKGGGKSTGGGMELLDRTVPAKISNELAAEIREQAKRSYRACRLSGMLRIDFMYSDGKLYCTEINPIPGSLAFYLWEAGGEPFQEQITQGIEDALQRHADKIHVVPYETDIVDKFIG
jgi:D-alanine-D-alanine ligase